MRLADFILANVEPILVEWDAFARTIWPRHLTDPANDPAHLRDHAEAILRGTATDMASAQSAAQQFDKSNGAVSSGPDGTAVDAASGQHGADRVGSGFELWAVVAEYRALRATVIRKWRESGPNPDLHDIDDLTRFNESIDQSLTEAVRSYTEQVKRDREALVAHERDARAEAETANRAKDMFLATLGHEMRAPLNSIVGWMGILRTKDCDVADLVEGLDVIDRNTKAQVQLIEDILDVSRIVSGKLRLEMQDCDLADAISAALAAVRPAATAKDITIQVQFDPAGRRAICDAVRIQQVAWNLLSNAAKFTQKGGTIRVALVREPSNWLLTVSDNGPGMSPDLLPFVFDRFRQADSSTRRKFGGLGLGLSIVKHLVGAHGGTVEAASEGEGRGSTFTVRLPIKAVRTYGSDATPPDADADAATQPPAGPSPVRLDGLHLLVVDDEADARRMLQKVLAKLGATVTVADGAAAAMALLDSAAGPGRCPDLLISDLGMPGQDGFDLIRQIRQRGYQARDLPAIALTGFARGEDAREAIRAGFQVHVPKPVDLHDLTAFICSLTGRTG